MGTRQITTDILNKSIYVWGTGKYARNYMERLDAYMDYCRLIDIDPLSSIVGFIDGNPDKQGKYFYGKPIMSIDKAIDNGLTSCVIAVLDHAEIDRILREKRVAEFMFYEEYLETLRNKILDEKAILLHKFKKNLTPLMRNNLEIASSIERWKESTNKKAYFEKMRKEYSNGSLVAAFSWCFGNNIVFLSDFISDQTEKYKDIKTIGIMADRIYGGGIEKVLSLLIPIYVRKGMRVVLLTDEIMPSKECQIPDEVIRYNMKNDHDADCYHRINELEKCVREYSIDIMCFHFGYTRLSTFYEMLFLKLEGIPVIIELHSNYIPIITNKKQISMYYPYMYRIADRVIVLSREDLKYWKDHGCKCTYIQNPVEDKIIQHIPKKKTNTILWVGRIVQQPKQVMEIVPIMREVVDKIPDVKLHIIGHADSDYVLKLLKDRIKENGLNKNIDILQYTTKMDKYYYNADIVLLTSSNESFSNVIQESKVYGIPLVLYKLPWLELLQDGKGYIAVDQNDYKAAAEAIIQIINDRALRNKMAKEARDSIIPFLDHDVGCDWIKVFEEISG